jgi:hypothetical protein
VVLLVVLLVVLWCSVLASNLLLFLSATIAAGSALAAW